MSKKSIKNGYTVMVIWVLHAKAGVKNSKKIVLRISSSEELIHRSVHVQKMVISLHV